MPLNKRTVNNSSKPENGHAVLQRTRSHLHVGVQLDLVLAECLVEIVDGVLDRNLFCYQLKESRYRQEERKRGVSEMSVSTAAKACIRGRDMEMRAMPLTGCGRHCCRK